MTRVQAFLLLYPVPPCRYEDFKSDVVTNVERMLNFLGFSYHHDEVEEKLAKDFSNFKRFAMHN